MKISLVTIILCFCSFFNSAIAQKSTLPNVIIVLADDIGVGDISAYRQKYSAAKIIIETPNLDKLISSGLHFTDAHSPAALCAPSRYSIMTGNYPHRSYAPWGVWSAYAESPLQNQMTLGQMMKNAGYHTGFFGKWHMGGGFAQKENPEELFIPKGGNKQLNTQVDISKYISNGPNHLGFDYSYTYPAGIQAEPYAAYENGTWLPYEKDSKVIVISQENAPKGVKLAKKPGLGDSYWDPHQAGPLLVNKAVDYINRQSGNANPFFLYYASQAVHVPHTPPKKLNGVKIAGGTPSKHLDMIKELDTQIGMLLEALKANGVFENTLIIFTSDNGGLNKNPSIKAGHNSSNGLRGSKNQIYEGGHRVPFIAFWKNKIKAGSSTDAPIIALDIMATLAHLTGQKLADDQGQDSFNFLPVLLNNQKAKGRESFWIQGGTAKKAAYRKGNMKLIIQLHHKDINISNPVALFNLEDNPSEIESKNLIKQEKYQRLIQEMLEEFIQIRFNN